MTKFWNEYLAGSTVSLELPKLPFSENFLAAHICNDIHPLLARSLKEALKGKVEEGILAVFAALLSHYTGQADLIIGFPPSLIRLMLDEKLTWLQLLDQIEKNCQKIQGQKPPINVNPHVSFQEQGKDLSLFCKINGELICLRLECRKGLYNHEFLQRMMENIVFLLSQCLEKPSIPILSHRMVSEKELATIFAMGKGKKNPFPKKAAHLLFEEKVLTQGNSPALFYEGKILSYSELNAIANQLARHLKELHIKPGEFVGLAIDRSMDHVIGLLAILKADGVPVPIDGSYPLERKSFMLEDTKAKILITQSSYRDLFPKEALKIFCLDEEKEKLKNYSEENLNGKAGPLDIININYTSGSTGKPKGVKVLHQSIVRLVVNTDWIDIKSSDRILHMANVSFDAASFEIWGALLNGACLYIYPHKDFSAEELADFMENQKVTHALFTARLFNLLIEFKLSSLHSLRGLYSVGDVMSSYHAKMAKDALSHCSIVNGYGPAENGVCTTFFIVNDHVDNNIPIGSPIANTDVYILDKNFHPVPIGVAGEIFCGGEGVAAGYLNRDELTKEKFINNIFGEGKLYRTGDLGRFLQNGAIEFMGRIDTQVKIRGFRVELGEIEECLRSHPKVADGVVIAISDSQGDKRLAAYVEPRGNEVLTADELRAFLETKLIPNMLPSFVMVIPKLPMTPNGKVDRKSLPPPEKIHLQQSSYEPPKTHIEEIIANIWASLLEIPRVGRKDNFFYLGGHSITAAQMAIMVDVAFNMKVPMGLIFEENTLESYAQKIKTLTESTGEKRESITGSELFWIWRQKELSLDRDIFVEKGKKPDIQQYSDPKAIFLTGSTGFVGSFMLNELLHKTRADIYCHVRAKNLEEGKSRIESALKKFGIWDSQAVNRIIPVLGDLEKPLLGIKEEEFKWLGNSIDCIYHFGAYVNHALPFAKLKAANVVGTKEALKLASLGRIKPFHFISTVAVFEPKGIPINEDDDLFKSKNLINGYAESKWIGEKLVMMARDRNIPTSIYRLARVSGHSKTGQGNRDDFLWRMMEASIYLKMAPDIGLKENITPADFICSSILQIASNPNFINQEYHVLNRELFPYKEIFHILQNLGYPLSFVSYEKWNQSLVQAALATSEERLQAVTPLFSEIDLTHSEREVIFNIDHVIEALESTEIRCPIVDEKLIKLYIDAFIAKGFFPSHKVNI